MTLRTIAAQARAFCARIPGARVYWKQHGLRALVIETFDVFVRRPHQNGTVNSNRWQDEAQFARIATQTDAKPLVKPRVLVIANLNLQQCRKYRALQKVEQLRDVYDIDVVISSYTDIPRAFDLMQLATSVLFYRVPDGDIFRSYLEEAGRLGLSTCYDIDDPIFSRRILQANTNLRSLERVEATNILNDAGAYLGAMKACDICTVSTPGMGEAAREALSLPVFLWRNAIDAESTNIANQLMSEAEAGPDEVPPDTRGRLKIAYMSGSRAHDEDFASVSDALCSILSRHEHVTLEVMGHAILPPKLGAHRKKIKTLAFASYWFYFKQLMDADIIVIPLLQDPFNECKSAIRLLEASTVGTPCVVSPVGDFANIAIHRETAMVAKTSDDWVQSLDELIHSAEFRTHIGEQSRLSLAQRYHSNAIASQLDDKLLQIMRGGGQ